MRKVLQFLLVVSFLSTVAVAQDVHVATKYNWDTEDSIQAGLGGIRGCYFHDDPFGDGNSAFLVTNYLDQGHVHLFVATGDDQIEMVWTSPTVAENGGGSTPRYPLFGDLDNDGLIEIIYQSHTNGIFIYEWDGVAGSYNFGDVPSQTITVEPGHDGSFEYAEISDIDNDGQPELIHPYNVGSNDTDGFFIVSANGTWSTGSPGFSSFLLEFEAIRSQNPDYDFAGGSPYGFYAVQFDGEGNKELLIHNWNFKSVTPVRVTGANTYEMAETANGKAFIQLTPEADIVALFGSIAYDIDGDGREELYMPSYESTFSGHANLIHMIHYEEGQSTAEIDESNVFVLDLNSGADTLVKSATFGAGYGDIDDDGKPNLYFSGVLGQNIVTAEFQGGDKTDPANWEYSLVYAGDSTAYNSITITDSAGVIDTNYSRNTAFASKIWARNTDFDKDGKEDMILPYQAYNDSVTIFNRTWDGSDYVVDTSYVLNDKRGNSIKIIEQGTSTGIEVKDISIIMPEDYTLEQNYPNPFNPTTSIKFSLPLNKKISLKVYDMLGKEVKTLIDNEEFNKGSYEATWDATNNLGKKVASGNYIAILQYGNFSKSIKMSLVK